MNGTMQLRALTSANAEALLELSNVCDIADVGEPTSTLDEITTDLSNADLSMVGFEAAGRLVGCAWVEARPDQTRIWADIRARPDHRSTLPQLFAWVLERAEQVGAGRPIWMSAGATSIDKQAIFEAAAGTVVRCFHRMLVDFGVSGPPASPPGWAGVEIAPMASTEAGRRTMHRLVDTAFDDHFGHEALRYEDWERDTLGWCTDPSLYWMATVDGEPAAGIYGCVLPEAGYIDTLGTLPEFRGRGIGRALLLTAFGEFNRRGVRRVTLAVDAANPTGAVGLYESVGMRVEHEGWRYEIPAPCSAERMRHG